MSHSPFPQMGYPANSSRIDTKDKVTIVVSITALLVSIGALLASVMSYRQSVESNDISANAVSVAKDQEGIARSQANLAEQEAMGGFTPSFTVRLKRGNNSTISKEVTWPEKEDFAISASEFRSKTTWLRIDIVNKGNKPITIHDIGLMTNPKNKEAVWTRGDVGYERPKPDHCDQKTHDIRCYQFSIPIPVAGWLTLDWPVWIDADFLLKKKAVNPVTVGIQSENGTVSIHVYQTNLVVR